MGQISSALIREDTYSLGALSCQIENALKGGAKSVTLFLTPTEAFSDQALNTYLRSVPVPVFGEVPTYSNMYILSGEARLMPFLE